MEGVRHPPQERELDKLRKTIEEYRIKAERNTSMSSMSSSSSMANSPAIGGGPVVGISGGGFPFSSSHEPLRVTSPPLPHEMALSPEPNARIPCSAYHYHPQSNIMAARRQSTVGTVHSHTSDRDKRVSSGSLSSMSSHASHSSVSSSSSATSIEGDLKHGKKKRWLPIKAAFSRSSKSSQSSGIHECEPGDDMMSPTAPNHQQQNFNNQNVVATFLAPSSATVSAQTYNELLQLVQDKDRKLTDVRLEALMSQHQLHQLEDQIEQMQHEMQLLRMENERLHACNDGSKEIAPLPSSPHHRKFMDQSPLFTSASSASTFGGGGGGGLRLSPLAADSPGSPFTTLRSATSSPNAMDAHAATPSSTYITSLKHIHLDCHKIRRLVSPDGGGSQIRFLVSSPTGRKPQHKPNSGHNCGATATTLSSLGNSAYQQQQQQQRGRGGGCTVIGSLPVARSITWEELDKMTCDIFTEYCLCVDGESRLGLSSSSIAFYQVGEQTRMPGTQPPQLLPCAFIIGNVDSIDISLKDGASAALDLLSFQTLIPKNVVQRYALNLLQKKQLILHGPSGTGKTCLAKSFARFLLNRVRKPVQFDEAVFVYDVKKCGEKDLRNYVAELAEKCQKSSPCKLESGIPHVLIVENCPLSNPSFLTDVFSPLLRLGETFSRPYIIGTSTDSKIEDKGVGGEIGNKFYWIPCMNSSPHVKDFLARYLRRSVIENEIYGRSNCEDEDFQNMLRIITWLPLCWHHINRNLEGYGLTDVRVGPHVFASCPLDFSSSCHWFIKVWNAIIAPFVSAALRKSSAAPSSTSTTRQDEGAKKEWNDPTSWVINSFPWNSSDMGSDFSLRLKTIPQSTPSPPIPPKDSKPNTITSAMKNDFFAVPSYNNTSPPPIPPRPDSETRRFSTGPGIQQQQQQMQQQQHHRSMTVRLNNGEVVTEVTSLDAVKPRGSTGDATQIWQRHNNSPLRGGMASGPSVR